MQPAPCSPSRSRLRVPSPRPRGAGSGQALWPAGTPCGTRSPFLALAGTQHVARQPRYGHSSAHRRSVFCVTLPSPQPPETEQRPALLVCCVPRDTGMEKLGECSGRSQALGGACGGAAVAVCWCGRALCSGRQRGSGLGEGSACCSEQGQPRAPKGHSGLRPGWCWLGSAGLQPRHRLRCSPGLTLEVSPYIQSKSLLFQPMPVVSHLPGTQH